MDANLRKAMGMSDAKAAKKRRWRAAGDPVSAALSLPETWTHVYEHLPVSERARGKAVCTAALAGLAAIAPAGPVCDLPPPVTYADVAPSLSEVEGICAAGVALPTPMSE